MDTIGRQVTAFVTLFMAASLIILMYLIFEPARRGAAAEEQRRVWAERGALLFAQNCVVCHGPQGRGIPGAGFPLDTPGNKHPDEDRAKFLRQTITRGRVNSTGKLPNMPAWSVDEGGPLNSQQIEDLVTFIGYGNFKEIPQILAQLGTPVSAIPTPPNRGTPIAVAASGPPAGAEAGAVIFDSVGCSGCHKIQPEYPNGGTTGPELTGVGSRGQIPTSNRTANPPGPTQPVTEQGLKTWIRNPEDTKPGALMPAFGPDVLSDEDLTQLVQWLLKHTNP